MMKRTLVFTALVGTIVVCATVHTCPSSASPQKKERPKLLLEVIPPKTAWPKPDYHWIEDAWTGGGGKFDAVRAAIDHQIAKGTNPRVLWEGYAKRLDSTPDDPVARAGWAYSVFSGFAGNRTEISHQTLYQDLDRALWILRRTSVEGSPELYRLRFLVESAANPSPELLPAGLRLLGAFPNDPHVKWRYAFLLGLYGNKADALCQSIRLLDELIHSQDKNPNYYSAQASAYWMLMGQTKQAADGEKAIHLFHKAESLFKDEGSRSVVRRSIERVRDFMKRLKVNYIL